MSGRSKETLKDILGLFPFYVLAEVAKHIFGENVLAGILFTITGIASYYVFMRATNPELNKKDVWKAVGFIAGILFVVMVINR